MADADDLDRLFARRISPVPDGFADRLSALARGIPQDGAATRRLRPWEWLSLGAGAGFGALLLCEFVFAAFVSSAAQ